VEQPLGERHARDSGEGDGEAEEELAVEGERPSLTWSSIVAA
jgi:hypothetical protein